MWRPEDSLQELLLSTMGSGLPLLVSLAGQQMPFHTETFYQSMVLLRQGSPQPATASLVPASLRSASFTGVYYLIQNTPVFLFSLLVLSISLGIFKFKQAYSLIFPVPALQVNGLYIHKPVSVHFAVLQITLRPGLQIFYPCDTLAGLFCLCKISTTTLPPFLFCCWELYSERYTQQVLHPCPCKLN